MLQYILYYESEEQYINLTVLLAEYKCSICLIQPFISQTNTVITYCCSAISYSRLVSLTANSKLWAFVNTSLDICTYRMVWGTILNSNCRTCMRRSPVRLFQGEKRLEYCRSLDTTHSSPLWLWRNKGTATEDATIELRIPHGQKSTKK